MQAGEEQLVKILFLLKLMRNIGVKESTLLEAGISSHFANCLYNLLEMIGEIEDQECFNVSPKHHSIQKTQCLNPNCEVQMVCNDLNEASDYFAAGEGFSVVEGLEQEVGSRLIGDRSKGSEVCLQELSKEVDEREFEVSPLAEGLYVFVALRGMILLGSDKVFDVFAHVFLGGSAEERGFLVFAPFVNAVGFYYSAGREHFESEDYEVVADVVDMLDGAGVP